MKRGRRPIGERHGRFSVCNLFSLRSNADYFQLNILMVGDYVRGRKKEITTWHDLEALIIAIKEVGGMAVFVPSKMSSEMDSKGILALKNYVDQGQGWGFLKVETYVDRGYPTIQRRQDHAILHLPR